MHPSLLAAIVAALVAADPPLNTPPEGFQALFNGVDLTHWRTGDDADKHWTVSDGVLVYDGKGKSLVTEKDYGNFILYVDWKIDAGGDSGIYLRGKPQVQIWDPKIPEARDWPLGSGGLFNNKDNERWPAVVADNPVGEWNTFKIQITGDKVSVDLNGKRVVDNVTMENWPKYESPLPATGPIELQHHGSPLYFRNIFLKELK